jgi:uncharacterized membrane protein YhaH (DUF805 family)
MDAVKSVYDNYANFGGRARRSEYWWFALFLFLVDLVAMLLAAFTTRASGMNEIGTAILLALILFSLASIIPALAVAVRRMHDTNRSGWWLLLYLLPIIGSIILLIWKCTSGTPGPNTYGADPKTTASSNAASVF